MDVVTVLVIILLLVLIVFFTGIIVLACIIISASIKQQKRAQRAEILRQVLSAPPIHSNLFVEEMLKQMNPPRV